MNRVGQTIDARYRVERRLGTGGMADVFGCEDLQLGRHVALKVLHEQLAEDPQVVARFRRESQSAAGLQHPHIVQVFDRGDWDGVRNLLDVLVPNSQSALGDGWEAMAANLIAGYGAIPLVGTPEQVIDGMLAFADAGLDGITLSWVNYEEGLHQFQDTLLPLMKQAGLRE